MYALLSNASVSYPSSKNAFKDQWTKHLSDIPFYSPYDTPPQYDIDPTEVSKVYIII